MATRLPDPCRNAAVDAVVDRLDADTLPGKVEIRTGAQPASAGDAATGTLLATITLNKPAFGAAATGTATAVLTGGLTADPVATDDAGWFRALDGAGVTVLDGAAAITGAEMTLNTVSLAPGTNVEITGWTHSQPAG